MMIRPMRESFQSYAAQVAPGIPARLDGSPGLIRSPYPGRNRTTQ
jgi:hypothetical protein